MKFGGISLILCGLYSREVYFWERVNLARVRYLHTKNVWFTLNVHYQIMWEIGAFGVHTIKHTYKKIGKINHRYMNGDIDGPIMYVHLTFFLEASKVVWSMFLQSCWDNLLIQTKKFTFCSICKCWQLRCFDNKKLLFLRLLISK